MLDAQVETLLGRTLQVESVAYPVAACCFRVGKKRCDPDENEKNCPCQYRHHSYAYSYVLQQIRRVKGLSAGEMRCTVQESNLQPSD